MMEGTVMKALSGFYYVDLAGETVICRGRGKLRHQKISPLVGDQVEVTLNEDGTGAVEAVLPRRNQLARPAVANLDQLIILCANVNPVSDPYVIDRVCAVAAGKGCEVVIAINKCDLDPGSALAELYTAAGFPVLRLSAVTGEGITTLRELLQGKVSAFTGNSGVGKSSVLNALEPQFAIETGEVSDKLGRGRHTTRHVELFRVGDALVADTPGFSSFEADRFGLLDQETLETGFREFRPYLGQCRFVGCSHTKEKGCAVLEAVEAGAIPQSRHESYVRLYREVKERRPWEEKQEQ